MNSNSIYIIFLWIFSLVTYTFGAWATAAASSTTTTTTIVQTHPTYNVSFWIVWIFFEHKNALKSSQVSSHICLVIGFQMKWLFFFQWHTVSLLCMYAAGYNNRLICSLWNRSVSLFLSVIFVVVALGTSCRK